jgi:hypothetical protein
MSRNLAALRLQVETALAGRVAAPFSYRDRKLVEMVSAGVPEIDALTGGLPRGGLWMGGMLSIRMRRQRRVWS